MSEVLGWSGVVLGLVLLAMLVREAAGQAASEPAETTSRPRTRHPRDVGALAVLIAVVALTLGPRLISLLM